MEPQQVKDIQWDHQNTQFFWDNYDQINSNKDLYFTKMAGHGLLNYVSKYIKLKGHICDYGAGGGYLSELLLNKNKIRVAAVGYSIAQVKQLNENLSQYSQFSGAVPVEQMNAFEKNQFNVIFFVETIEHILPEDFDKTIQSLYETLKPGGHLVVTCPNNEDLESNKVICPCCGSRFHQMQHLRSYNHKSLSECLETYQFKTKLCKAFRPEAYQLSRGFQSFIYNKLASLFMKKPSLIYIGTKPTF